MKKIIVAAALALFATTASATIAGSSHDLSSSTTTSLGANGTGGSSCAYCHMPHNGQALTGAPLWARLLPSAASSGTTYARTYSFYSSLVGGHTPPASAAALGGGTRACLSCHDGTQAIAVVFSAFGNGTQNVPGAGGTLTQTMGASLASLGTNLQNDHPVSVLYTNAGQNYAGLSASPPVQFNITNGTSNVECTSCHNAHNQKWAGQSYSNRFFMVSYVGDFCAACHSQK